MLLAVALSNFNRGQKQGEIRLIDVARRVPVGTLMADHPQPIDYVVFSPDGSTLAAQSGENLIVWHISESTGDVAEAETVE